VMANDLPRVYADRAALVEALINILTNAFKYTGPKKRIVVEAQRAAGPTVRIAVTDNGPGITAENLPRVFEPFFTTRDGGLGLGLSLSQTLAEGFGGRLTAHHGVPRGAELLLTLPLAEGAQA